MRVSSYLGVMRYQDDGDSLGVELLEHLKDFDARPRIEIARRLIRQNERRAVDQRPSDRHALLLSPGHLRRFMVDPAGQADAIQ